MSYLNILRIFLFGNYIFSNSEATILFLDVTRFTHKLKVNNPKFTLHLQISQGMFLPKQNPDFKMMPSLVSHTKNTAKEVITMSKIYSVNAIDTKL